MEDSAAPRNSGKNRRNSGKKSADQPKIRGNRITRTRRGHRDNLDRIRLFAVQSGYWFVPARNLSALSVVSIVVNTRDSQPIQRGGRLLLARQAFVNAGLRPPPPAAAGVDKGSPRQPCSPPCVRRKGTAEPPSPTPHSPLPTPNSEEALNIYNFVIQVNAASGKF